MQLEAPPTERLLATKLFVPPMRHVVSRAHLLGKMQASAPHALTLVSAPPGYGKTTLVVEWLRHASQPFAWLSLDAADNDPVHFFTYLIAALWQIDETVGAATAGLLNLPQLAPAETLATALINELAMSHRDLVLVLDDYHSISAPLIHQAVEFLVHRLPPGVQIVLITREDPPFSLARLRVRAELLEIRADDLRFTSAEAAQFFKELMGLDLAEDAVRILEARTEGWIAGLQLAALSLQGQDAERVTDFIQAFDGSDRYIIDYLLDEVLRRQTADIRTFLCQTAVLNRLTAPLCDAVTGRTDSRTLLAQLERANLFLVPLDSRREWFRYHHLFAEFLRIELNPAEQAALHRRAAEWFHANGFRIEAIEQALLAQDMQAAAAWIEQAAGELFRGGELVTLSRWLAALPEEAIRQNVNLATFRAWTLYFSGELEAAGKLVNSLDTTRAADTTGRGRLVALRAALCMYREEWCEASQLAREALDLIGDTDPFFGIMTLQDLAEAERHSGHSDAATALFHQGAELAQRQNHPFAALIALTGLAPNLNRQGRRREALAYCHRMLEQNVSVRGKPLPLAGLLNIPLGVLEYAANELGPANDHVRQGLALYKQLGLGRIAVGDGELTLVQILCAQGELEGALALARETHRIASSLNHPRMALLMSGSVADVQLKLGDLASAGRWADEAERSLPIPPHPSYEVGYFVLVRILLAQQRVEQAQLLLGHLYQSAFQDGRRARLVTVYILQALAHHALGNHDVAVDRLDAAVQIAAPEGYQRAFLDEGHVVAELLPHVRDSAPEFVDALLAAFGSTIVQTPVPAASAGVENRKSETANLPEPLSDRELEVLRLLADGKSNAQIAQELVITLGTAKWHVHHVLNKLGVDNRAQVVIRARELDIL